MGVTLPARSTHSELVLISQARGEPIKWSLNFYDVCSFHVFRLDHRVLRTQALGQDQAQARSVESRREVPRVLAAVLQQIAVLQAQGRAGDAEGHGA